MGMDVTYFVTSDQGVAERCLAEGVPEGVDAVTTGFEPVVQGSELIELLTGKPVAPGSQEAYQRPVAMSEDGQALVLLVDPMFVEVLASSSDEALESVCERWAEIDEFAGMVTPEELAEQLIPLGGLARRAESRGLPMYCYWLV